MNKLEDAFRALEGGLKTVLELVILVFPLSRAEHRRGGRKKARGLFEPR